MTQSRHNHTSAEALGSFATGAAIGAAAGAAAAVLFTPKSGKEVRTDIKSKAVSVKDQAKSKVKQKADELKVNSTLLKQDIKDEIEKAQGLDPELAEIQKDVN